MTRANNDDVIVVKKRDYLLLKEELKRQKDEIADLRSIISDGDISVTVDKICELKNIFEQKAPVVLYNFSLYPIGAHEREALVEFIEELKTFINRCDNYLEM